MAERIKGLSIGLDLDSTKVNSNLTAIKRAFRGFNSELKTNLNNFKYTEKSADSYKTVIKDLNKAVEGQTKTLKALEGEYDSVVATQGKSSKKAQILANEYNKQADNLNRLQHQLDATSDEFREFSEAQRIANSKWTMFGDKLDSVGGKLQNMGQNMKNAGRNLTFGVTMPIVGAGAASFKMASDFEESMNKVEVAFGSSAGEVKNWSKTTLDTFGLAQGSALDSAALFGDMATSMGLSDKEASKMSTSLVGLGADLASFKNIGMDQASTALKSIFTGETESLKELGIVMTQTNLERFAQSEGIQKSVKDMTQQEQVMLRYKYVMENTKNAQGDFARTSEGAANQQRIFGESLKELGATIGQKLLPIFTPVIKKINDMIKSFAGISDSKQKMVLAFAGIAAATGPVLLALGSVASAIGSVMKVIAPLGAKIAKAGGLFKFLGTAIGAINLPLTLIIGAIAGLGIAFVVAYNKSSTFRNFINGLGEKIKVALSWIGKFKDAILNIFKGNTQSGQQLLKKLGLDQNTINIITTMILKVKNIISRSLTAIKNFASSTIKSILQFWKTDGAQIMQAVQTVFGFIVAIVRKLTPIATKTFGLAWKAVSYLIKSIWENIKGIIRGGLQVIKGIIQVFSGIFTGDFRKMWEGIKNIFSGAIKFLWNFIQLMFYGKIIKGGLAFAKLFAGSLKSMWTKIVGFFKSFGSSIVKNTKNSFTNLYNGANRIFSKLVSTLLKYVKNILSNTKNTFNTLKNSAIRIFHNLWTGLKTKFSNIWNSAKTMANKVKSFVTGGFKGAYENAKKWIGNLVGKVTGMKDKVVQSAKDLASGLKKHAIGGLNSMIDGVNWVGNKLGMGKSMIPRIKFSRGTQDGALAQTTLATVGDRGKGNGHGNDGRRETVMLPNGKMFLTPNRDTDMVLPKGTRIFNGQQTQEMFKGRFSLGTMFEKGFKTGKAMFKASKDGATALLDNGKKKVKNIAKKGFDIFEYITNPKKLLGKALDMFGVDFSAISGIPSKIMNAMFNKLKSSATETIKKWFGNFGMSADGTPTGNGFKGSFTKYRMTTPYSPGRAVPGYPTAFNGGRHFGIDYGTPVGTPLQATLSGTVSRAYDTGGGLVAKLVSGPITQFFMHLSSLMKTGKVKKGETFALTGNSGQWTTGPHLHWQAKRGGGSWNQNTFNPLSLIKGHANGGYIESEGLFNLHPNEYVVPMDKPTEAMKIIAMASRQLAGKSKQTSELPNLPSGDGAVVQKLTEQNGILIKMLEQLTGINAKEFSISQREIADAYDRHDTKAQKRQSIYDGTSGAI